MLKQLDADIFRYLNTTFHFEPLNSIFIALTSQKYAFIPLLIIFYFIFKRYGKKGWWVVAGIALSAGLADFISSGIMKKWFMRPRPCQVLEGIFFWDKKLDPPWIVTNFDLRASYKSSYSFPSSHAANSMAAALFSAFYLKKGAIVLVIFSLLIGYSRIHVGVHYLSDILTGFVVGGICAFFIKYLIEWIKDMVERRGKRA